MNVTLGHAKMSAALSIPNQFVKISCNKWSLQIILWNVLVEQIDITATSFLSYYNERKMHNIMKQKSYQRFLNPDKAWINRIFLNSQQTETFSGQIQTFGSKFFRATAKAMCTV